MDRLIEERKYLDKNKTTRSLLQSFLSRCTVSVQKRMALCHYLEKSGFLNLKLTPCSLLGLNLEGNFFRFLKVTASNELLETS